MKSLQQEYIIIVSKLIEFLHANLFLIIADSSQSLPFIELGTTTGVGTSALPAQNDGVSGVINVPIGFAFANTTQTTVYVSIVVVASFCNFNELNMCLFLMCAPERVKNHTIRRVTHYQYNCIHPTRFTRV